MALLDLFKRAGQAVKSTAALTAASVVNPLIGPAAASLIPTFKKAGQAPATPKQTFTVGQGLSTTPTLPGPRLAPVTPKEKATATVQKNIQRQEAAPVVKGTFASKVDTAKKLVTAVAPEATQALDIARAPSVAPTSRISAAGRVLPKAIQEGAVIPAARLGTSLVGTTHNEVMNLINGTDTKYSYQPSARMAGLVGKEKIKQVGQEGAELGLNVYQAIKAARGGDPTKMDRGDMFKALPFVMVGGLLEGSAADIGLGGAGEKAAREIAETTIREATERVAKRVSSDVIEIASKLHPEDALAMTKYIDDVRLGKPLTPESELAATRIAEHYGTKMPKTPQGLADQFDHVLATERQLKDEAQRIFDEKAAKTPKQYFHGTRVPLRDEKGLISLTDRKDIAEAYAHGAGGGRKVANIDHFVDVDTGEKFASDLANKRAVSESGKILERDEVEKLVRDGQLLPKTKEGVVHTFEPNIKNTLDLTHSNGVLSEEAQKVLSNLESKGTPLQKKSIEAIKEDAARGNFDWIHTKYEPTVQHWKESIIPQLEAAGYDSIKFADDVGETLAVFDPKTLSSDATKLPIKIENASGFLAGIEPELDENGHPTGKIKYDPARGIIGFAGVSAIRSKAGGEALEVLKKASKDYLNTFLANTEQGAEIIAKFNAADEARLANPHLDNKELVKAVRGTGAFKKEKSVADWMAEAEILRKEGSYKLARNPQEAHAAALAGWERTGNSADSLAKQAGFDDGAKYIEAVMKYQDGRQDSIRKQAEAYLMKNDQQYQELVRASKEVTPETPVYRGDVSRPPVEEVDEPISRLAPTAELPPPTGKETQKLVPFREPMDEKSAEAYVKQMVKQREAARSSGIVSSVKERLSTFWRELKTKLVDSTAPIEEALADFEKQGNRVLPTQDVRLQIDRVLRAPSLAGQFIKDTGLEEVVRNVDNIDNLEQYLIARHSMDLAERGIETGRDLAKDRGLVEVFGPRYEQQAQQVRDFSRQLLDYSVDKGLISEDLAKELKEAYPNYIPMNRVFDELEQTEMRVGGKQLASISKQNVVKKIVGSKREVESPIASLLLKTRDAFVEGERNEAARMLADFKPFQESGLMRELGAGKKAQHTVSFLDKGVKRTFETTPELAAAAKSLNVQELGTIGRALALPNRIFKLGTTGINPSFILANLGKDQLQALNTSAHALSTSGPQAFLQGLVSAVRHDELYDQVIRDAAMSTSFDVSRNQALETVGKIRSERGIGARAWHTVRNPGELLRAAEDVVGRTEELTRIQQYKGTYDALIKQGRTVEDARLLAAKAARENTANFARRGEWGKVMNAMIPYLSAGIQGTRSTLRAFKERPLATTAKVMTSLFIPVATATAWNLSDPKRKEAYEDILDSEKENNIIIIPPNPEKDEHGNWNVIKIPMPPGLSSLTIPVQRGIEQMYGLDPVKFQDVAQAGLGLVSPINIDVRDPEHLPSSIASSITPQLIKPTLESYTNKRFFSGSSIVPKKLEGLAPEAQVYDDTSGLARIIGSKINASPLKVQEWVKGTFGSGSAVALHYADALAAEVGAIPEDQVSGTGVGGDITRRYAKAYGGKTEDKFYDELNKVKQQDATVSWQKKLDAEALFKELKAMPKDQANARAKEIKNSDPALFEKLKDVVADEKAGLSSQERAVKGLGVDNGSRAKFIYDELLPQYKTSEEKNAYIKDLTEKKVVNPDVKRQLQDLIKNNGEFTPKENVAGANFDNAAAVKELYDTLKSKPKDEANAYAKDLKQRDPDMYAELKAYAKQQGGDLGSLSAAYESSGSPGAIGYDRTGGYSYGAYQLAHNNAKSFVDQSAYANDFKGLQFNSKAWQDKWKEVAARDPQGFKEAQKGYIEQTHFKPQLDKLASAGIDIANLSTRLKNVIWSTAVQHGANTSIVAQAFKALGKGASEDDLIRKIYALRWNGGKNFASSTVAVRNAVKNRFFGKNGELAKALSMSDTA